MLYNHHCNICKYTNECFSVLCQSLDLYFRPWDMRYKIIRCDFVFTSFSQTYHIKQLHWKNCLCFRSSDCRVWGVPAYWRQYPAPWEPLGALPCAETAEREKDEGVGSRLDPLIKYSFDLLQELPLYIFSVAASIACMHLCLLGHTGGERKTRPAHIN